MRCRTTIPPVLMSFACAIISASQDKNKYQVVRVHPDSEEHIGILRQLTGKYKLDPWREVSRHTPHGDYMVDVAHAQMLKGELLAKNISYSDLIEDAESYVMSNHPLVKTNKHKGSNITLSFRHRYLTYEELLRFLNDVKVKANQVKVTLGSLGRSFQGKVTPYVKISKTGDPSRRKTIFIDGGIHAREWIAPAMAVEIIHQLAFNPDSDPDVERLLQAYDWVIVPLVNPDGYAYSFNMNLESRLWRKSRNTAYTAQWGCVGVDLNRNFGYMWSDHIGDGGSSDPCSTTYSGPYTFSEPETRNLAGLMAALHDDLVTYISLHSFGQFLLYPWGFSSSEAVPEEDKLIKVGSAFADVMKKKNYKYTVGGSAKMLYPASGSSSDFVRGDLGVGHAYTLELPPTHTDLHGFMLPEEAVQGVTSDTWAGLKAMTLAIMALDTPLPDTLPAETTPLEVTPS